MVVNPIADLSSLASIQLSTLLQADADNVVALEGLINRVNRVKSLDEIAMVLINSATIGASTTNNMAANVVNSTYLSRITWNFTAETDFHLTHAKYHTFDQGMFYTYRDADLSQSSATQLTLAASTLFSHRMDDLLFGARSAIVGI
jgi:hypothetical protein